MFTKILYFFKADEYRAPLVDQNKIQTGNTMDRLREIRFQSN